MLHKNDKQTETPARNKFVFDSQSLRKNKNNYK